VSYLDLARQALEKLPQSVREVTNPPHQPRHVPRKPWDPSPEEEAAFCRVIEKDQGLPAGSVRLYSPQEFRRRLREVFGMKAGRA
jgi:hypothetical protein